ncbi:MAG: TerC family protein [Bryobacteraceae bacterium]|nr:TerC family protein [Bryobacteraceae bacterium]
MVSLFPFSEYWWFYLSFTGFVLLLLAIDLGVFHRKAHVVSFREAAVWSAIWVTLALVFNYLFYQYALWRFPQNERLAGLGINPAAAARQAGLEFFTGYLVEKSLSVDNIFVFVLVFRYFAIPSQYQHRVLFFGILGALIFRAIFITMGAMLLRYEWVVFLFGAFLIFTGIKMLFVPDRGFHPEKNPLIRLFRKLVPVTDSFEGQRFFVRRGGKWFATPLMVVLVFVEATDIVFAIDSVPAIFALTREPLIVYTSNVFAILGLRAMYFLLAGAVEKFHMLKYGLALVLIFVGLKMVWLNHAYGGKFPIGISLAVISVLVGVSIALSFLIPKRSAPADAA